jgi:ABC-type Na+ efflux pump permease subunit
LNKLNRESKTQTENESKKTKQKQKNKKTRKPKNQEKMQSAFSVGSAFEKKAAAVLFAQGFTDIALVGGSSDGGIDIRACLNLPSSNTLSASNSLDSLTTKDLNKHSNINTPRSTKLAYPTTAAAAPTSTCVVVTIFFFFFFFLLFQHPTNQIDKPSKYNSSLQNKTILL